MLNLEALKNQCYANVIHFLSQTETGIILIPDESNRNMSGEELQSTVLSDLSNKQYFKCW